eukprot:1161551-Pelagomonas_calceolata.AAC.9
MSGHDMTSRLQQSQACTLQAHRIDAQHQSTTFWRQKSNWSWTTMLGTVQDGQEQTHGNSNPLQKYRHQASIVPQAMVALACCLAGLPD